MKKEAFGAKAAIISLIFILSFYYSFPQQIYGNGLFTTISTYRTIKKFKTNSNDWIVFGGIPSATPFRGLIFKFNHAGFLTDTISIYLDSINSPYHWWENMIQTNDNGFLLVAKENNYHKFSLVKLDSIFNVQWAKTYYISSFQTSSSFQTIQLKDQSYLFSASMDRKNSFPSRAMGICKLDSLGNILWEKSIGDTVTATSNHEFYPLKSIATDDYGFIVSGSYENWDESLFISKFDSSGILQWFKLYQDTSSGANHLIPTRDILKCKTGGFYFVGNKAWLPGHIGTCPFLMKVDTSGNIEWAKYFNDYGGPFKATMNEMANGDLLITCGDSIVSIVKANNLGDTLWTRQYRGCREGITYESNDSLILATNFYYYPFYSIMALINLDSTGYFNCNEVYRPNVIQDINTINTSSLYLIMDYDTTITETPILAFDTSFINMIYIDYCLYTHIENIELQNNFVVFPNPSDGNFTITFPNIINKGIVKIYSVLGEKVFEENISTTATNKFNLKNISVGIYFVKVLDGEKYYGKKIIIERD